MSLLFGYVYDGRRKGWFCHRLPNLKEKKNWNVARYFLFHSHLPNCFCSYALNHTAYLINKLCTAVLKNLSLFEVLFHTPTLND